MTPEETRTATRNGVLDAITLLAQAAAIGFGVMYCFLHPGLMAQELALPAVGFGVIWALFTMADSKRAVVRGIGAVLWKVIGYAILWALICLITSLFDPHLAGLLATLPIQLWKSMT